MSLEVILDVKYKNIFDYQFEYFLQNKNKIDILHILYDSEDSNTIFQYQILKLKYLDWIKTYKVNSNKIDFLNKNFKKSSSKYVYISSCICWQNKNFLEDIEKILIDTPNEIIIPQIFNSERTTYLHQIFGMLKTFTFRPWDDEYIDSMNSEIWDPEIFHYLHNNYLSLIEHNEFDKIKFNKYYFNGKENIPKFSFAWSGSIDKTKRWVMAGSIYCSILAPSENIYKSIIDADYAQKYKDLLLDQFSPKHYQLVLNFKEFEIQKINQLSFEFDESEINQKFENDFLNKVITKQSIKIAINSHKNSSKKIINRLVNSLLKNSINVKNIVVVIGGSEENKKEFMDGVLYQYVTHNSYDHTAMIAIIEENYDSDYWLCLHDTCEAGKNFYNNLINHPKSYFSAILEEGWLNMGLFSRKFILDNKDYILKLKNCNKMRAILSEQIYSRLGDSSFINSRKGTKLRGKADIYNDGIERLIIYFSELDLYKYQSFHYNSEYTKELTEKYTLKIEKLT